MQKNKMTMDEVEERDLIDSTQRGEWVSVGDVEARRTFWKEAAKGVLEGKR